MDPSVNNNTNPNTEPAPTPTPEPITAPAPTPEPITEPTPAVEQTPILTPEPTITPAPEPEPISTPESTPISAPEPPKPNNKPLIISAIVILIALVVAGGFAFAKFFPFNQGDQPSGDDDNSNQNQNYDLSAMSDFDLAFLRLQNKADNVVYSPISIKYALAMLSDAADGNSKTQITNLIGNYTPKTYTNNANRSFANAMFIREKIKGEILSSYTTTLQQKYNASVVYDAFTSVAPINQWIADKTMNIIKNMLSDDALREDTDFMLINALAIDMDWDNQLQCAISDEATVNVSDVSCKLYNPNFGNEKYYHYIPYIGLDSTEGFKKLTFNGEEIESAEIGVSANRYDIVKELGEEYIRSTVLAAYDKWKAEENDGEEDEDFDIDNYMEELGSNYGQIYTSTDFYFSDNDDEKVFAKDLKTYDDSTLQYVGIMPKNEDLNTYVNAMTVENLASLINSIKDASVVDNYKDGVVTQVEGYIPFFNFNYNLKLKEDLMNLGVTDVFNPDAADLSKLTSVAHSYIQDAFHKADIDFSNDGIKAAAATVVSGGLGAGNPHFVYKWDVPVEKIDITFNKPFFFIIRDKSTGEIWFAGTVYHPSK